MAEKFKRRGSVQRACPWCWKHGLAYVAIATSVKFTCANRCGYYAWVPKQDLSMQEREYYYQAKRK